MWTRAQAISWLQRPAVRTIAVSCASSTVSAVVAYGIGKRRTVTKQRAIADKEIEDVKAAYDKKYRIASATTPEEAVRLAGREPVAGVYIPDTDRPLTTEEVRQQISEDNEETVAVVEEQHNVFDNQTLEFDYEFEASRRAENPNAPFVISRAEFNEEEDFDQAELTFYPGDLTLADEMDMIVSDVAETIGDNLTRFGYGSDDANVVYVKCPTKSLVFSVVRSSGSYAKEVLGLDEDEAKAERIFGD